MEHETPISYSAGDFLMSQVNAEVDLGVVPLANSEKAVRAVSWATLPGAIQQMVFIPCQLKTHSGYNLYRIVSALYVVVGLLLEVTANNASFRSS